MSTRLHTGHLLIAFLLLAVAFLGWRAMAALGQPVPAPPPFSPPPLADRAFLAGADPFFGAAAPDGETLPVTALPFSLHGIRTDAATGEGSAIIATGDGEQKVHAVGETLADDVRLIAIALDHVVLESRGVRESLWLDVAGPQQVERHDPTAYGEMPMPTDDPDALPPSDMPPSDVPDPPPPSSVENPQ